MINSATQRAAFAQDIATQLRYCLDHDSPEGFTVVEWMTSRLIDIIDKATVDSLINIPMILFCPKCGTQHIDEPSKDWENPPHRSHLCASCQHVWRPADVCTTGVLNIETCGRSREEVCNWPIRGHVGNSNAQLELLAVSMSIWGPACMTDTDERMDRCAEEFGELSKTMDYPLERLLAIVKYGYKKPVGDRKQELAGMSLCLMALASAINEDLLQIARAEITRITTIDPDKLRAKQALKWKHNAGCLPDRVPKNLSEILDEV